MIIIKTILVLTITIIKIIIHVDHISAIFAAVVLMDCAFLFVIIEIF